LAQSSAFAQAINDGENVIEDSEKWIQNLTQQKAKSGVVLVGEQVISESDQWISMV